MRDGTFVTSAIVRNKKNPIGKAIWHKYRGGTFVTTIHWGTNPNPIGVAHL